MECGNCTLCCELPELHEIPSAIGELCSKCIPKVGCSVQDNKPKECKIYQCAWVQMSNVGKELRPDKCGVIFDKVNDKLFHGITASKGSVADSIKRQVQDFLNQGFSVVIKNINYHELAIWIADNYTKEQALTAIQERERAYK